MSAKAFAQISLPCLTLIVTVVFSVEATGAQSPEVLRKQVLEAWQRRQDTVESAAFKIRGTLVLAENEVRRRAHRFETLHRKESKPKEMPRGDTILLEHYEVAFDKDKLRFSMTFDESTHEIAKSVNRNMTLLYVTNGTDYRSLDSFPDHGIKSGTILNADQFLPYRNADVEPIIQAFRAFAQQRQQRMDDLAIVNGEHAIDGSPVVVIQERYDSASSSGVQYWTDPSRQYVVLRMLSMAGDSQAGYQADIEYEQDDSGNWVPVKWVRTDFSSDAEPRRIHEFLVVEYEINPRLPPSLFELEFGPGVDVFDKRKWPARASAWTVNKDGSKTMKRGVDPDRQRDSSPGSILLLGSGMLLLFLVVLLLRRRKHWGF